MNDQEKAYLRRALEEKILTIEQVDELRKEIQRTGRPLMELVSSGMRMGMPLPSPVPASPPRSTAPIAVPQQPKAAKIPPLYAALLAASCLIFSGLLVATVIKMRENTTKDRELAIEQSKNMTETERLSAEARVGYQRSIIEARESKAKQALAKAREAMARAGDKPASAPEVVLALNEAFVGYNGYLDVIPDDADVRIERAKTHQMRRNYDLAIADLERAAQLKPERAQALRDQVSQLRLLLARNPK